MRSHGWLRAGRHGVLVVGLGLGLGVRGAWAQPPGGVAERLGGRLDGVGRELGRGVRGVTEGMRRGFQTMRGEVERMNASARVFARLRWDKSLEASRIEVHMLRPGVVLLRGPVPDRAARQRAVALATETVGVTEVIDELAPLTTASPTTPAPVPVSAPAPAPVVEPADPLPGASAPRRPVR